MNEKWRDIRSRSFTFKLIFVGFAEFSFIRVFNINVIDTVSIQRQVWKKLSLEIIHCLFFGNTKMFAFASKKLKSMKLKCRHTASKNISNRKSY